VGTLVLFHKLRDPSRSPGRPLGLDKGRLVASCGRPSRNAMVWYSFHLWRTQTAGGVQTEKDTSVRAVERAGFLDCFSPTSLELS
jgi:hypothetical protein